MCNRNLLGSWRQKRREGIPGFVPLLVPLREQAAIREAGSVLLSPQRLPEHTPGATHWAKQTDPFLAVREIIVLCIIYLNI
jgi:hypothetical protein